MADDPSDVFDKFADDIRSQQDELSAVDALRSAKAKDERKRKPDDAQDAPPESAQLPKAD